jgi:hypothetical protein
MERRFPSGPHSLPCSWPRPRLHGAVAFDAVGTVQTADTGTSVNIPITIGSGSNRAVVVSLAFGNNTTGVTCTMNSGAETLSIISGTDGAMMGPHEML